MKKIFITIFVIIAICLFFTGLIIFIDMGSENSFKVFPTPFNLFSAIPPDKMTRYERHPIVIAPLMSASGAGSAIDAPCVVSAGIPKSANMVPTNM